MFYLKQFFKVVFSNPVSGISFCVLTISLTIFIGHNDLFLGKILNVYRPSHPDPYFFALITSNDDVSEVARKLARLPGIKDVKVEDPKKIQKEAKELIHNMGVDVPEYLLESEYKGMKVILNKEVNERSMALIKEYIVRLIGVGQVTLSNVKVDDQALDAKYVQLYHFFESYGVVSLSLVLLIPWFVLLLFFRRNVRKTAFLIEHYQRKNNVGIKIAGLGIITIVSLSNVASLLVGVPSLKALFFIVIIFSIGVMIHLKKWFWKY